MKVDSGSINVLLDIEEDHSVLHWKKNDIFGIRSTDGCSTVVGKVGLGIDISGANKGNTFEINGDLSTFIKCEYLNQN